MNLLELRKVDASPWGKFQLHQVDLELCAGEVLGVIGPNGAGKTSLLQLLAGDIAPTLGSYDFLGTAMSEWEPVSRAQHLAVLPQLSLLNFPYTVEEVILLGRTPHSSGHDNDLRILGEVMQATDTGGLRGRTYTQLSGGEKQRVQLARVFAQVWQDEGSPRLLLLDEPTTALDLAHQQLILETIRALSRSGCGVVVVAHDFNLVAAVAQQVVAVSSGRLAARGSPEEVFTEALFEQIFAARVTIARHPESGQPLVIHL